MPGSSNLSFVRLLTSVAAFLLTGLQIFATGFSLQNRLGFQGGDDWEPAMAADHFGHLYLVYYHIDVNGQSTCTGCDQHLLIQSSSDGGNTWSAPTPVAPGSVKGGQFDPWVVVDPADGRTVWISFMQGFPQAQIALVKSSDFGNTWSAPTIPSGSLSGLDKDVLAIGDGMMAVFFDDYYTLYASISTNGGLNWTLHSITTFRNAPKQLLCSGAGIDSLGNIFSAWNLYDSTISTGSCRLWVEKSKNGGETWTSTDIDQGGDPYPCSHCGAGAYLAPQIAMRIGSDDTIYLLWNTTTDLANGAPERIFFSRSTDHGMTYSPRKELSTAPVGAEHCFPALASGAGPGDIRVGWMDTRTGAWNVFYRASMDGGVTFGSEARLTGFTPGYSYLTEQGFQFPYGDYFQMAVDACGATHAAFGESAAYTTAGNIWVSNEQPDWRLSISYQANQVRLSWPVAFAAELEVATNLPGAWNVHPTMPSIASNQWFVSESVSSFKSRFYRLRCH